jgi:hypothetical protein
LRPLRRRFCTTRTPPRSLIRCRKPCTRWRYRFLGWKVRLMGESLVQKPGENRGSVPEGGLYDGDTACVTYPSACMPCDTHRPLLHSPPGSRRDNGGGAKPVQIAPHELNQPDTPRPSNSIVPLPGFGIDRMGDFRRLCSVSLWKSGPLFSTGTKEAKLVVRELRLNQRSAPARFARARTSAEAGDVDKGVGPRLSTAFAEQNGHPCTGPHILPPCQPRASGQGEVM